MQTRFHNPRKFFERTKDRYGQLMEEYHSQQSICNRTTDFNELEQLRNQSRTSELRYDRLYQFILSGGLLAFIYYFLKLAQHDLANIFYNF
jgi:hypothetical protein